MRGPCGGFFRGGSRDISPDEIGVKCAELKVIDPCFSSITVDIGIRRVYDSAEHRADWQCPAGLRLT